MEGKVSILPISIFCRDRPGSRMARAGVMQLLYPALVGGADVETQEDRSWAGRAAFPQWRPGGCPVGEEQPGTCSQTSKTFPQASEKSSRRILRRLYIDKRDDETAEFMTSFTLTS